MATINPGPGSKDVSTWSALLAIISTAFAVGLLALLHVLSPEFSPAWRMVSEYGNGRYEWVLSLMFTTWGVGTLALAFAIRSEVAGKAGTLGLWLLVIAGLGEVGGGVFDINHEPGHSTAGFLGILGLPVAAVLISIALSRDEQWAPTKRLLLGTAHLTWISVVLLGASFVVMVVSFLSVQGSLPTQVPQSVPAGVIALVGWTNRLLVLAYCAWVVAVAWLGIRLRSRAAAASRQPLGLT
jgi:hypothetical membrane protein